MPGLWLIAGLTASALFAGGVTLFSTDPRHRLWGQAAVCGYALAAFAVLAWRSRPVRGVNVALTVMVCGAILFPLLWLIAHGYGEPEVGVVAQSADQLIHDGTPYRSTQALAGTTDPNAYNPYLPLMAVFGVPQALLGHGVLTDPRVWFGAVFIGVFAVALRIAGARDTVRWALLLTASPIIAFELCVGGTDVPMVAFMCLGFALLWGARENTPLAAGLALGIASSMKATAWPALAVAFALLCVRDGQRAAWRFVVVAVSVVVIIVGPFAVLKPGALVKNTILFPLGLASVRSQADSPLLGHVLAQTGVIGHTIVVVLLVGSGLAIAVSLVIRPPRDVPAATIRLVLGLSFMFVLAPSTRFGYFIYPAAMILWLLVSQAGRRSADLPDPEDFEALTLPVDPGALTPPEDPEDPKILTTPTSGLAPLPALVCGGLVRGDAGVRRAGLAAALVCGGLGSRRRWCAAGWCAAGWCAAVPAASRNSRPGPRPAQLPHGSQPGSPPPSRQPPQCGIAVVLGTAMWHCGGSGRRPGAPRAPPASAPQYSLQKSRVLARLQLPLTPQPAGPG